jgi:hypothetical protein
VNEDEWRVEVELDDAEEGYGLGERLRSRDLDDDARRRLGERVYVSRDGSRLFLYAGTEAAAREAERVSRELLAAEGLTAEIAVTRWHPIQEEWEDASVPLPQTEAEIEAERDRLEQREQREAAEDRAYDWLVKAQLPSRSDAVELQRELAGEGHQVRRLWRYVEVGALTEERAGELAESVRERVPTDTEVWVDANADEVPDPVFVYLETRLPGP